MTESKIDDKTLEVNIEKIQPMTDKRFKQELVMQTYLIKIKEGTISINCKLCAADAADHADALIQRMKK